MKSPFEKYGFSQEVVKIVEPIIEAIKRNDIRDAEKRIAELALQVCDKLVSGTLSPKEGDNYFSLLDIYMTDHYPQLQLTKEIRDILFEGMILHDYGKDYGANVNAMRLLAQKVIGPS